MFPRSNPSFFFFLVMCLLELCNYPLNCPLKRKHIHHKLWFLSKHWSISSKMLKKAVRIMYESRRSHTSCMKWSIKASDSFFLRVLSHDCKAVNISQASVYEELQKAEVSFGSKPFLLYMNGVKQHRPGSLEVLRFARSVCNASLKDFLNPMVFFYVRAGPRSVCLHGCSTA